MAIKNYSETLYKDVLAQISFRSFANQFQSPINKDYGSSKWDKSDRWYFNDNGYDNAKASEMQPAHK